MKVETFGPTYKRKDGLTVIYGKSIPLPEKYKTKFEESGIVVFPPGAKGGNHKHPRIELLYSPDNLTIIWEEKGGKRHEEPMGSRKGKFKLFITKPGEAHAVVNRTNKRAVLVEFAEILQHHVKSVELI